MKRVKLLELGRTGANYDIKIPKGTEIVELEKALATFIIDVAEYRKIGTATFIAEISA